MKISFRNISEWNFDGKIGLVLPYLFIILFIILLACLGFKREILNYGIETDFLGGFVPEATRFLNGESLQVEYHPPFYSIVLALIYKMIGDWMKAGLILSIISSFIVMISCYKFFSLKFGRVAGISSILALTISTTYISYSMQATSDLFFMALFFSALAFIAIAVVKKVTISWLLAGLLVGMTIITRTNGIALLGFLLFPVTCVDTKRSRIKSATLFIAGLLIPLSIWFSFAIYSGSPISPTSTYKNLAQNYFSGTSDRVSGDALNRASEGLTNVWQVIEKDPPYIAKTYIRDLIDKIKRLFLYENLLSFPYSQLALLGLIVLIFLDFNTFNQVLAFNIIGSFLLLNFKAWENRFFLYFVPFMGAGIGCLLAFIYAELKKKGKNTTIFLLVLLFSFVFIIPNLKYAFDTHSNTVAFDSVEASKTLKNISNSKNSIVIARKPHLGFYSKLDLTLFPDVESMDDLKSTLQEIVAHQPDERKIYLFYGYCEKRLRPKLKALGSLEFNAPWLSRVSWGNENGRWILYEVLRNKL